MADDWFYDKEIVLMTEEGHMEYGSWVADDPTVVKTIQCDAQPVNREQIYKQYGYSIDCTKRVFCDLTDGLDAGSLVKFNDQLFDVVKVIQWDDYLDVLMKEKT